MDNYKLHQRLGKGAQGSVYLVENKADRKKWVLKKVECNDESEANKAFKEAMALQELQHPHICGYREFFVTWDKEESAMFVCIVMDYYELGDLDKALKLKRKEASYIEEMVLRKWFGQMVSALTFVHNKQVIHRDLKPSNIFLTGRGNISIGDFGVATIMDDARTRTRTTVGTMNWMAPEVLERPYDERSDVWSLGCILLEMTTCGFMDAAQMSSVLFQMKQSPQVLEEVLEKVGKKYNKDLCQTIRIMLRRNFQQRPTAKELSELPYVKSCVALGEQSLKKGGSTSADKKKAGDKSKTASKVKPVPKDKGINGVLGYMKENEGTVACQVEALKHLESVTRKSDVSLNAATKKTIALTMKKNCVSKEIQVLCCKIFINLIPKANENDVMYTAEIINPILLAMRVFEIHLVSEVLQLVSTSQFGEEKNYDETVLFPSHAGSSELQTNACSLIMAFSADEAAAEVIGRQGGVQDVLAALRAFPNNSEIASNCCGALWSLAVNENNCKIVTEERGVHDVCSAMETHEGEVDLVESACSALWSLSLEEENVEMMVDLNVVEQLTSAMVKHKKEAKVVKNACMALASIVEASETCAYQVLNNSNGGLQLLTDSYKQHQKNEEVVENICVLCSELVEYDDIRDEMKSMKIADILAEAKKHFSSNEDLVTPAVNALVMLGGGQRSGRRNSSARSRPRSAARKS